MLILRSFAELAIVARLIRTFVEHLLCRIQVLEVSKEVTEPVALLCDGLCWSLRNIALCVPTRPLELLFTIDVQNLLKNPQSLLVLVGELSDPMD